MVTGTIEQILDLLRPKDVDGYRIGSRVCISNHSDEYEITLMAYDLFGGRPTCYAVFYISGIAVASGLRDKQALVNMLAYEYDKACEQLMDTVFGT